MPTDPLPIHEAVAALESAVTADINRTERTKAKLVQVCNPLLVPTGLCIGITEPKTEDEIIKRAVRVNGELIQVVKCVEELSELAYELLDSITSDDEEYRKTLFHAIENALELQKIAKSILPDNSAYRMKERTYIHVDKVVSELVDVGIITNMMKVVFGNPKLFESMYEYKLNRLDMRLDFTEAYPLGFA